MQANQGTTIGAACQPWSCPTTIALHSPVVLHADPGHEASLLQQLGLLARVERDMY